MNLYGGILSVLLISLCFPSRVSGFCSRLLSLAGICVYAGMVTLLNQWRLFEGPASFCYGLILILYGLAARRCRPGDLAAAAMIWNNLLLLSSLGVILILTVASGSPRLWMEGSPYRPAALWATALLRAAIAAWVIKLKRKGWFCSPNLVKALVFYLLFEIWGAAMIFEILSNDHWLQVSLLYYVGFFTMTLFYSLILWVARNRRRERWEQAFFEQFCRQQEEQEQKFLTFNQQLKGVQHDMKGHLATVYLLLKSSQEQKAADYLKLLSAQLSKLKFKDEKQHKEPDSVCFDNPAASTISGVLQKQQEAEIAEQLKNRRRTMGVLTSASGLAAVLFLVAYNIVLGRKNFQLLAVLYGGIVVLFGLMLYYFYHKQMDWDKARQAAVQKANLTISMEERRAFEGMAAHRADLKRELDACLKKLDLFSLQTKNNGVNGAILRAVQMAREALI